MVALLVDSIKKWMNKFQLVSIEKFRKFHQFYKCLARWKRGGRDLQSPQVNPPPCPPTSPSPSFPPPPPPLLLLLFSFSFSFLLLFFTFVFLLQGVHGLQVHWKQKNLHLKLGKELAMVKLTEKNSVKVARRVQLSVCSEPAPTATALLPTILIYSVKSASSFHI